MARNDVAGNMLLGSFCKAILEGKNILYTFADTHKKVFKYNPITETYKIYRVVGVIAPEYISDGKEYEAQELLSNYIGGIYHLIAKFEILEA